MQKVIRTPVGTLTVNINNEHKKFFIQKSLYR